MVEAREDWDGEEEREIEEYLTSLDALKEVVPDNEKMQRLPIEDEPEKQKLELKVLPPHLKYVFLDKDGGKPVIISNTLSKSEEDRLISVLKDNQKAIGWALSDLKGISPSYCMHKIHMEQDYKPVTQPYRKLNPVMKDVVRKEVLKLLEAGIIYPISDSSCVSPIQVVPEKGGTIVVHNEKKMI